jgi:hypothetical protein
LDRHLTPGGLYNSTFVDVIGITSRVKENMEQERHGISCATWVNLAVYNCRITTSNLIALIEGAYRVA